jgi:hypothetical protein
MLRNPFPIDIRCNDLVNAISRELSRGGIYLSDTDIRDNLEDLEDYLEGIDFRGEDGLMRRLRDKLALDKVSGGRQGLYRSRRQFYVFCHAARHVRSIELAKALLRFLRRNADDIEEEEKDTLMTEWCHGLVQLRGLVDGDGWNSVFQKVAKHGPPMFEEWRKSSTQPSWMEQSVRSLQNRIFQDDERGRHQVQRYDCGVRTLSVPARRPTLIDLPPYPRTVYSSPLLSPMYNAVDIIQEAQQDLLFDIAMLQRRVDGLRHRY